MRLSVYTCLSSLALWQFHCLDLNQWQVQVFFNKASEGEAKGVAAEVLRLL